MFSEIHWIKYALIISGIIGISLLVGFSLKKIISKLIEKKKKISKFTIFEAILSYSILWSFLIFSYLGFFIFEWPQKIHFLYDKFLLILFIICLGLSGSKILTNLVDFYLIEKGQVIKRVTIFDIFVKIFVFIIAFVLILHTLGINITPFITTLGIAGLAIGLALRDTLENFFAGLHILMAKQIKPGDYIRLETGEEGFVEDITWRTTIIRLLSNNVIIIPNSKLSQSIILNYHLPQSDTSVVVQIGVSYESDLEKVEKITLDEAKKLMKEHPQGVPDFEPVIRFHTFGEFSINFNVILKAKQPDARPVLVHEFIKRIHKRYKQEGIEIPFPIRKVYLDNIKL